MEPHRLKRFRLLPGMILLGALFIVFQCFKDAEGYSFRLIIFEGSDWCPNCRRLEKNILNDSVFLLKMKSAAIQLERVDFPQRKKLSAEVIESNQKKAGEYGFDGQFPTLIISRIDTLIFRKIAFTNQSPEELANQILMTSELLR